MNSLYIILIFPAISEVYLYKFYLHDLNSMHNILILFRKLQILEILIHSHLQIASFSKLFYSYDL